MWEDDGMTITEIYLLVVCEYVDPVYVEFMTAYVPDEQAWESPLLYPFPTLRQRWL
jgi:hypothetical protein